MKNKDHVSSLGGPTGVRILNEHLDEVGAGIDNARVRAGAAISVDKLNLKVVGEITVGTTETIARHGLREVPTLVCLTMRSAGTVWESGRRDGNVVRLTADASGRKVYVVVGA